MDIKNIKEKGEKIKIKEKMERIKKEENLKKKRNRWKKNEEIDEIIIRFERKNEWK
jgi:hypothetical protein